MVRNTLKAVASFVGLKSTQRLEDLESDEVIRSYIVKIRSWLQNFTILKHHVKALNEAVNTHYETLENLLKAVRDWETMDACENDSFTESDNQLIHFLESMLDLFLTLKSMTKIYLVNVDKAVEQVIIGINRIWTKFETRIQLNDLLLSKKSVVVSNRNLLLEERKLQDDLHLQLIEEVPLFNELVKQLLLILLLSFVHLHILRNRNFAQGFEQFSNLQLIEEYRDKVEGTTLMIQDLQCANSRACKPKTMASKCVAIFTFLAQIEGDLSIVRNQIITILDRRGEWFYGEIDGSRGIFPSNYVRLL